MTTNQPDASAHRAALMAVLQGATWPVWAWDGHSIVGASAAAARMLAPEGQDPIGASITTLLAPPTAAELAARWEARADGPVTLTLSGPGATAMTIRGDLSHPEVGGRHVQLVSLPRPLTESHTDATMLAMLSHEVRTPMASIVAMADALRRGQLDDEQRTQVELIELASDTILALLNDMQQLPLIAAGQTRPEETVFSPLGLAEDCVNLLSPAACGKGLDVQIRVATPLPRFIRGDAGRIRQVLLNLLSNSIKYTSQGYVAVTLDRSSLPGRDEGLLKVTVDDTGCGVPDAVRRAVFDPYVRGHTWADAPPGAGLGLAIAKRLVEVMGGEIGYSSGDQGGSSFWFTSRIHESAASFPEEGLLATAAPSGAAPRPESIVLIVDDSEMMRHTTKLILDQAGYRVLQAATGQEAIDAARSVPLSIVLMDVMLADMPGPAATAIIRTLPPPAGSVPVVAVTGKARPEDRDRLLASGMTDYVSKPFGRRRLLATVAAWLPRLPLDDPNLDGHALTAMQHEVGADGMPGLLRRFVAELGERRSEIDRALDRDQLSQEAHALRTSAHHCGAFRVTALAGQLEEALRKACAPATIEGLRRDLVAALDDAIGAFQTRGLVEFEGR